ncbi:MAG: hypothetical protein ACRDPL_03320, partial [Propionibacteriaceae bacterium]
ATASAARIGIRVHDHSRLALPALVALPPLEPRTLRAGLGNVDLYTATRHYFGWYAWNVLELDARDIALHFGHRDGGELVRKLYGHADARPARERVRNAFRQAATAPAPLVAAGR